MEYELTAIKPVRVGRVKKMTKQPTTINAEVSKATRNKYSKTRGEHFKDIVIAMLITGIVAFIGGMYFSNQQHNQLAQAVRSAVAPTVSAQAPAKK